MTHFSHTAIDLTSTGTLGEGRAICDSEYLRLPSTPVLLLDDDSLLIIFSLCRPLILDEFETDNARILAGGEWIRERWWYRLIQVCRRWRYIVLESVSYLRLSLVCTRGTPVADMLAHSPPIPLIIDHFDEYDRGLTAEDEEGIILAFQHRNRVRRVRLMKPVPILEKLITALDGEFPILEFLDILDKRYHEPVTEHVSDLRIPEAFLAPHLRRLLLTNCVIPIGSPLLTMENLVTLSLDDIPSSAYFHPNALLQRLLLMPQLETLGILFNFYNSSFDVERQTLRTPITTRVTLPNLRWLAFRGTSAYLEALLPWVDIPLLEKLQVYFFNRLVYSIPRLRNFMSTAENLLLKTARIGFAKGCLEVTAFPHKEAKLYTLDMSLGGKHFDWQVVSAAQVFHELRTAFSAVEHLTLNYYRRDISLEWNNEADRTRWREFLGVFGKVKTLFVDGELVEQVSRALQPGEEESPMEMLPELQELSYSAMGASPNPNAFALFIDTRRKAGRPVTTIHL